MTRPLRIEYSGAFYHITSRGNKRLPIFENDLDRKHFLNVLADACATYNWRCHAYCLMNNHYHLLIETLEANLAEGMRNLNGIYTQDFNYHHNTVGHLLQGRYKAFLIEAEIYLQEVVRYVVLNPVRAKLVNKPERWKWSNYAATAGLISPPKFLTVDTTLKSFSKIITKAQKQYSEFVHQGVGQPSPFTEVSADTILGSPQFIAATWDKTKSAKELTEIKKSSRLIGRPNLEDLFDNKKSIAIRNQAILSARKICGYSITEIADHLQLSRPRVSNILRDLNKHYNERPDPVC